MSEERCLCWGALRSALRPPWRRRVACAACGGSTAAGACRCGDGGASSSAAAGSGRHHHHHHHHRRKQKRFTEEWDLGHHLGEGGFGVVRRGKCRTTGLEVAVKQISRHGGRRDAAKHQAAKHAAIVAAGGAIAASAAAAAAAAGAGPPPEDRERSAARLASELAVASSLRHPNVARLFEVHRDSESVYMVMELCSGGELFDRIEGAPCGLPEREAMVYARQMISSIAYLHACRVVHRDVKPENFLLQSSEPGAPLKLIDFGLSRRFAPGHTMSTMVGTPYYMAPEVVSRAYTERVDVWSIGIITYALLCGNLPFTGKRDKDVLARICKGAISFPSPYWDDVSDEAIDLVEGLLTHEPVERPTAIDVLSHPALQLASSSSGSSSSSSSYSCSASGCESGAEDEEAAASDAEASSVAAAAASAAALRRRRRLARFQRRPAALRLALASAAWRLPDEDTRPLLAADSDVDFAAGDADYLSWLTSFVDPRLCARPGIVKAAFRALDADGDGVLSRSDLALATAHAPPGLGLRPEEQGRPEPADLFDDDEDEEETIVDEGPISVEAMLEQAELNPLTAEAFETLLLEEARRVEAAAKMAPTASAASASRTRPGLSAEEEAEAESALAAAALAAQCAGFARACSNMSDSWSTAPSTTDAVTAAATSSGGAAGAKASSFALGPPTPCPAGAASANSGPLAVA